MNLDNLFECAVLAVGGLGCLLVAGICFVELRPVRCNRRRRLNVRLLLSGKTVSSGKRHTAACGAFSVSGRVFCRKPDGVVFPRASRPL